MKTVLYLTLLFSRNTPDTGKDTKLVMLYWLR